MYKLYKGWQGFMGAINKFLVSDSKSIGNIKAEEWVTHFQALLNPPMSSDSMSYAEHLIKGEFLDKNFSLREFQIILSKAKNNKALGCDGIPYAFYKYAPDSLLAVLL